MLTDAELAQMLADAERIEALRAKATPGPWEEDWFEHYVSYVKNKDKSLRSVVSGPQDANHRNNNQFIAATRTDPSAANVLRLLEEVELLRKIAKRNIPHPPCFSVAFNAWHFERLGEVMKHYDARRVIDACHIHGVPVPEHPKAYEKGGDA